MKKIFYLFCLFFIANTGFSTLQAQVSTQFKENVVDYSEVTINVSELKSIVQHAPLKGTVSQNRSSTAIIALPIPTGGTQRFRVVEAPILSPELSLARPQVKSYMAIGIDDPTASARFNITAGGFYGVVKSVLGISIIELIDKTNNNDRYVTYYDHNIKDIHNEGGCESDELVDPSMLVPATGLIDSCFQNGANMRNYDMVVTCSGEFYALNGGTDPLVEAALLARITQINAVYETELATTFTIVEYLLNSNAATDPFSNPTNTSTSIAETESYINANVTVGSWDIGHGFHEITCGGSCGWAGRAGLAVVCTTAKARGYTYLPNDIPTSVTVLLHEIGHMFSNRHSNYGCDSNNACSRFEPGRGSTIMSTGAGCDAGDFFANRTDYFSVSSLQNMFNFMNSGLFVTGGSVCGDFTVSGWSDCATLTPTGNSMPSANANANSIDGLTIPHSTPFELTGAGTDADGLGSLTYTWEQYDTDYSGSDAPDDTGASTTAPLFRSFPPSTSNQRTLPLLSSVLAGNVTTGTGEVLPTVARDLNWRFTVRDNEAGGGGVACDQITLTVGADGPFQISSQNSTTAWVAGATQTVTWDVANTDSPAYSCPNIDILYSSDGGVTFSTTLASGVANDGSQDITVPAAASTTGRIKIVCTGGTNVFFDINNVDIAVITSCNAEAGTIANNAAVVGTAGDPALNLSLLAGLPINSISGVLNASDGNTNLTVENNGGGTCISFSNNPKFETIELATGSNANVTFTRTAQGDYTSMIGLFQDSYNTSSVCDNWLNSNGNFTGASVSVGSNFIQSLTTGTQYVLLTSGFNSATPPTGNYNVSFSQTLYNTGAIQAAGFLYTYVVVNTGTGNIVAFTADSDLSDEWTFPAGSYTVHGLSYLAGEDTAAYVGTAFTGFEADIASTSFCGDLSSNSVPVTINAAVCTTATYTGAGWSISPDVPTGSSAVVIASDYNSATVGASINACSVVVNSGVTLTIAAGDYLRVKGDITVSAGGTLIVEHQGSVVQEDGSAAVTNNGTINVELTTPVLAPRVFMILGSPMTAETRAGVFGAASMVRNHLTGNFIPNADVAAAFPSAENFADDDGDNWVNYASTINPAEGYLVRPQADITDGGTSYDLTYSLGTLNNGDTNFTAIYNGTQNGSPNILSNPYASAIDADDFINANSTIVDALYFWEHNTPPSEALPGYNNMNFSMEDISMYNLSGGNMATSGGTAPNGFIATGQGFGIKALTGGTVTFNNTMRRIDNNNTLRTPLERDRIWLQVKNEEFQMQSSTLVAFLDTTAPGFDQGYDGKRLATAVSLYSHLPSGDLEFGIQAREAFDSSLEVPMGFSTLIEANIEYSISIANLEGVNLAEATVYLIDNQENTITNLSEQAYSFTADKGTYNNRFVLLFESRVLGVADNQLETIAIYPNPSQGEIYIASPQAVVTSARIFDIRGRLINQVVFNNPTEYKLDVSNLESAVYFVRIITENGTITKRIIKE